MADFFSLLVANRGEIAVRVMRTAAALGYRTVAVYSDADAAAPHVRLADDAVRLGPAPASESYLRGDAIIEAAKSTGADAIHPGYGFLSENADFARAVEKAGLVFVGPTPDAIALMGDKAKAKRRMIEAGVPCVPGYEGDDQSDETFIEAADKIGYPVMVKAAAGGGGRGMRLVGNKKDLPGALALARSEAENAFGSGALILEKAILRPRHVEVQVIADEHGGVIHLGERDCSVQRRHQKVIEEAPCPVMTPELRAEMGAAAVRAAESVGYRGAGTVEFLLDDEMNFHFLEMNTRLQVEHPVTELVTRLDLVALQLRVARGEPLDLAQDDITFSGHAIEVRLYAEDPAENFLPSTGRLALWRSAEGPDVRVDDGIETGGEVSPYYDPMIAKVIARGANREQARRRLVAALQDTALFGPRNNRDFLIAALEEPAFVAGEATTAFIAEAFGEDRLLPPLPDVRVVAAAAVLQHRLGRTAAIRKSLDVSAELLDWCSAGNLETVFEYEIGETVRSVSVVPQGADAYRVTDGDSEIHVHVETLATSDADLLIDGRRTRVMYCDQDGKTLFLSIGSRAWQFTNLVARDALGAEAAGGGAVTAPMHGRLLEIFVAAGETVKKGDKLAVLEAMKMQHEIVAEIDGTVGNIAATADSQLAADDLILEIEPDEEKG